MKKFWDLADESRISAEFLADHQLRGLQTMPIESLRRIFVQYRYFTIYYIADMALLVHRLPFGKLRSLLAEFLSEELGEGNENNAHPNLYDSFLTSVGIKQNEFDAIPANIELLEKISTLVAGESFNQGVGLRGLGGECLCQLYLSAMHTHFSRNPEIQEISGAIDWRFWEIHIGDIDVQHRLRLRAAIDEEIAKSPECEQEIRIGYEKSKSAWDQFWTNIFNAETIAAA